MAPKLSNTSLESWFNQSIGLRYRTRLTGGASEPEYTPAIGDGFHRIFYRNDYIASALHELAHWSIASATRGKLHDYGYWYEPDGRNPQQQQLFEQVEVKPQAIEWLFSVACGLGFRVSADNLDQSGGPSETFIANIIAQAKNYRIDVLPPRAREIIEGLVSLCNVTDINSVFSENNYSLNQLSQQSFA